MISLRSLKMKRVKKLDTEEKVKEARKGLEDATEESLINSHKAKLRAWHKSRFIILD